MRHGQRISGRPVSPISILIKVEALPGTLEGAAGSLYYTSQITITAQNTAGAPVRYEGEVVLRRVNDVPGASADQLHWHINSVTLDQTH